MDGASEGPDFEDARLHERVLPAMLAVIERGDFSGPVMRKVANECRMSLNTLYSIVPSKNDLLLALAMHLQTRALAAVMAQMQPGDTDRDITRRAVHASFDEFTRVPGLALAILSATVRDSDDPDSAFRLATDSRMRSAPGLAAPFDRNTDSWRGGRLQVLTIGWLGTTYCFARGILTLREAREALDWLIESAYLLPISPSAT